MNRKKPSERTIMEFLSSLPSLFVSLCFFEIVMSLASLTLFGLDKLRARGGGWRVPETTLLLFSFLFGGIGGVLGMHLFRHKTKHTKFQICVPSFAILQIACIIATLLI